MTDMIGERGRGLFTYWNQTRVGRDSFVSLLGFTPACSVCHAQITDQDCCTLVYMHTSEAVIVNVVFTPRESPYWKQITFKASIFELVRAHPCQK